MITPPPSRSQWHTATLHELHVCLAAWCGPVRICCDASPANHNLNHNFHSLGCSHHCLPRWQVYKSHLVETGGASGPQLDSARANLANTFVNAFVNAGFGQVRRATTCGTAAACCSVLR